MKWADTEVNHIHSPSSHLVALDFPHLNDAGELFDELKFGIVEEDGTPVGSVVLRNVDTRRVWFGVEGSLVAEFGKVRFQELVVVHFLLTKT